MCLERISPAEVASKEKEFEAHGWAWVEHQDEPRRIVLMRKDFAAPVSERTVEQEIKDVMGERYVRLAAPGSPRALGAEGGGKSASDRLKQLVDEGWELTELPEHKDSDGHTHGGGQLVRRKMDPRRSE